MTLSAKAADGATGIGARKKKLPAPARRSDAPPPPEPGEIATLADAKRWITERRITEIECVVPDQAGVARGKIMPAAKFLNEPSMALPSSIFAQTIAGEYPDEAGEFRYDPADGDLLLRPDFSTLCLVPWATDPTAQVILDGWNRDGRPFEIAPRQVLKRVLGLYEQRGWKPVVAPEIEFYLVKRNTDPDYPLEPPVGRSGRPEAGRRSFSISAVNEFDDLFERIYEYAEAQGLEVDTLIHEEGAAQMEFNLIHGDPLWLADQVFLLKRTIREAALKHDIYATFMAKPIANEPGSAMHIHQSVTTAAGKNLFSGTDGGPTGEFFQFLGGQQKYLPAALCIFAPYVNSFRRLIRGATAPTNVAWGYDNRTTGLRVPPHIGPEGRRVENRLPSSDCNPYLAIAASLACGLLGIDQSLSPTDPTPGPATSDRHLPASLLEAVTALEEATPLVEVLGTTFCATYAAIKRAEFETFMRVISPWEREYLLLNV